MGIYGQGADGSVNAGGGSGGEIGSVNTRGGGNFGGGGGGAGSSPPTPSTGGSGAVRIIWSFVGTTRAFPSTNTGDV